MNNYYKHVYELHKVYKLEYCIRCNIMWSDLCQLSGLKNKYKDVHKYIKFKNIGEIVSYLYPCLNDEEVIIKKLLE